MVNSISWNGIDKKKNTTLLRLMFTEQDQRMTIDFEKDQEQVIDKTTNINKLADKIQEMQAIQSAIESDEQQLKQKIITFLRHFLSFFVYNIVCVMHI